MRYLIIPSVFSLAVFTQTAKQPAKLEELKTPWEKMNAEMIDTVWSPKR